MRQEILNIKYTSYVILIILINRNTRIVIINDTFQDIFIWTADIQIYNILTRSHYLFCCLISKANNTLQHTLLIESFKSTLDEVREADLLLHVVDISHPNFEEHIQSVNQILAEIHSADKPTIMVFNKIDAYTNEEIAEDDLATERTKKHFTLDEWKQTWMQRMGRDVLFISALNKNNLEEFREVVYEKVKEIHITRFPFNNFLYEKIDE